MTQTKWNRALGCLQHRVQMANAVSEVINAKTI